MENNDKVKRILRKYVTIVNDENYTPKYVIPDKKIPKITTDIVKLFTIPAISDSSFDWDKFAETLSKEHGSSHLIDDGNENNPYDYWLMDVTVKDIVDFIKNYR